MVMKMRFSLMLAGLLMLAACAAPGVQESILAVPEGAETVSPLEEPALSSPLPTPAREEVGDASGMMAQLKPLVAAKLGLGVAELTAIAVEEVEWSDASLGCPQPGMMYAQVITPGWRFTFEGRAGQLYDVHTAQNPTHFIICEQKEGVVVTPFFSHEEQERAAAAAQQLVAERKGMSAESLTVVSVEAVQWPNSCLGCADPNEMCLMVITPGYRVLLQAGDARYEVHTDCTGRVTRLCEGLNDAGDEPDSQLEVPENVWQLQQATLAFLETNIPGFGLEQLPQRWEGANVTLPGLVGASHYRFSNVDWTVNLVYPVVPEPLCAVSLHHAEAGLLWQGNVSIDGQVIEEAGRPALTYETGACDQSVAPEDLQTWAGADVEPVAGGFRFTHRIPYVCCADVVPALGWDSIKAPGTLRIVETNLGEVCRCMCGYELTGEVGGLKPGSYTVEFWGVQKYDFHPLELLASVEVVVNR